jgi:hypothetical protein
VETFYATIDSIAADLINRLNELSSYLPNNISCIDSRDMIYRFDVNKLGRLTRISNYGHENIQDNVDLFIIHKKENCSWFPHARATPEPPHNPSQPLRISIPLANVAVGIGGGTRHAKGSGEARICWVSGRRSTTSGARSGGQGVGGRRDSGVGLWWSGRGINPWRLSGALFRRMWVAAAWPGPNLGPKVVVVALIERVGTTTVLGRPWHGPFWDHRAMFHACPCLQSLVTLYVVVRKPRV